MKQRFAMLLMLFTALISAGVAFAGPSFEMTTNGVRYITRDANGQVVSSVRPEYDAGSGNYYVKDEENRVVARQSLSAEASMENIKIVAPAEGESHSVKTRDFLGNTVPVLRELPACDSRYQMLKGYIDNDPGLKRAVAMQLEARNYKIDRLQQQLGEGVRDPQLTSWLVNDLKKPVYLEVGDSGSIYHDPKGFVMAERGADGQVSYRDQSHVNRLVIPSNSEAFNGGMNDSSAASVIAHEVGHMVMDQVYERANYPKTNYHGPHAKNSVTDEGFALSEGWAEAFETLANKERLDSGTSWRIKSQKNIAENKYIFKNQGVVEGPNDGILKNGGQMLSTEGVNASLFYDMLQDNRIQAPYSKVLQVFEQSKPQTYRDFLKNYIEMYPEDRSQVIKQYLENTKYATVDSSAVQRYKSLHDAQQAYLSASPDARPQLEADYQAKLNEYNQWKEQAYKQTVVDGQIDRAVGDSAQIAFSDDTAKQFRSLKLSETILKSQKALGEGLSKAADSIKESFSVKSVAMTAGTSIAINLASQIMSGEKPSVKKAFQAVASLQFVGNVVGSTMGAAAGHVFAPLIRTFVPIPVIGQLAGVLLPTLGSLAGGQFGGNLGAGMAFKQALKSLDPFALTGQALGSMAGSMLGAMIPIPVLGPMIGGMIGGIIGEKVFTGIAKLFGWKKNQAVAKVQTPASVPANTPDGPIVVQSQDTYATVSGVDASRERIAPSLDRIPYDQMHPNLRAVKDDYEKAYRSYVGAVSGSDQTKVKAALNAFVKERERYRRALSAYVK
jgi:hypothetical protein